MRVKTGFSDRADGFLLRAHARRPSEMNPFCLPLHLPTVTLQIDGLQRPEMNPSFLPLHPVPGTTLGSTPFNNGSYLPGMLRHACLFAVLAVSGLADDGGTQGLPAPLSQEQIEAAVLIENVSIPSAGELFAAFNKTGKHDWSALFRKPPVAPLLSRPQIALSIGILIAEGCLAAEAQDRQQVKNVSREIKLLAKSLGLEQEFVGRKNSIADLADSKQWDALDEELDAVQNELAASMTAHRDDELVTLMALGCWLRSLEIISSHLATNYTGDAARILRQPAVVGYFTGRLDALPAKLKAAPIIAELQGALPSVATALSSPADSPASVETVAAIRKLTTDLLDHIGQTAK